MNVELDIENKIIYINNGIKFCELYKLKDVIKDIDEYTIQKKENYWNPHDPWKTNPINPWQNPWIQPYGPTITYDTDKYIYNPDENPDDNHLNENHD